MHNFPKVSIITVVLNDTKGIACTLESIRSLNYSNLEYIVIDGGSRDDTLKIIEKNLDIITHFVSEPDRGIYDAMNKGIMMATGEWLIFMNAGDCFYNSDVIHQVFCETTDNNVAIIGGDIIAYNYLGLSQHIVASGSSVSYKEKMPCNHQAAFIRKAVHEKFLYDFEKYPLCADYAMMSKVLSCGYTFKHLDVIVAWFNTEGVASKQIYRTYKECKTIPNINRPSSLKFLYIVLCIIKNLVIQSLPSKMRNKLLTERLKASGWQEISEEKKNKLPL